MDVAGVGVDVAMGIAMVWYILEFKNPSEP